jgi:hypothetical protein
MRQALITIKRGLQARRCSGCRGAVRDAVVIEEALYCHGCAERLGVAAEMLEDETDPHDARPT